MTVFVYCFIIVLNGHGPDRLSHQHFLYESDNRLTMYGQ